MVDELTLCAAAFFRSIGKDVTTSNEFVMIASLELKWLPPSDSKLLLKTLLSSGIMVQKGEYIRASSDLSGIDLPLAYKPSPELVELIHKGPQPKPAPQKEQEPDLFHILMDIAKDNGIQTKDFVPPCTRIQKALGIDIAAAALIVLRDNGVDISGISPMVYRKISAM